MKSLLLIILQNARGHITIDQTDGKLQGSLTDKEVKSIRGILTYQDEHLTTEIPSWIEYVDVPPMSTAFPPGHEAQFIPWPAFSTIVAMGSTDWGSMWAPWNQPDSRLPPPWGTGVCDLSLCKCSTKPCHDQSFLLEGVPPRLWEIKLQYGIKNLLRDYSNHALVKNYALVSMGWSVEQKLLFGIKLGRYYNLANGVIHEIERSQVFVIGGNSFDIGLIDYEVVEEIDPPDDLEDKWNWATQAPCPPGRAGTVDNRTGMLINLRQCRTFHETFNPQPTTRMLAVDLQPCDIPPCSDVYPAFEVPVLFDDTWHNAMTDLHRKTYPDYGPWRPIDWCLDPFTGISAANQNDTFLEFTDIIPYPEDHLGGNFGGSTAPSGESWFFATFLLKDEWATSKQESLRSDRPNGPWLDPRLHTYRSCFDSPYKKSDILAGKVRPYPPGYDPSNGPTSTAERKNYPLFNVRLVVYWDETTKFPYKALLSREKIPGDKLQNATATPGGVKWDVNKDWEDSIISIWSGFGTTTGNNARPDYSFRHDHGMMVSSVDAKYYGSGMGSKSESCDRDPWHHYGMSSDYEKVTDRTHDEFDMITDAVVYECHDKRAPDCLDAKDYVERANGYRSTIGEAPTFCALLPLPRNVASPHVTLEDDYKIGRTHLFERRTDINPFDKVPATWSKWNGIHEHGGNQPAQMAVACLDVRTGRGMRLNMQGGWIMNEFSYSKTSEVENHPPRLDDDKVTPFYMGDSPDPICDPEAGRPLSCDGGSIGANGNPYGDNMVWTTPGIGCTSYRSAFYQRSMALPPGYDELAEENRRARFKNRPNLQWNDFFPSLEGSWYHYDMQGVWFSETTRRDQRYYENDRSVMGNYKYVQKNAATIAGPFWTNNSEFRRARTNCITYPKKMEDIPHDDFWDPECEFNSSKEPGNVDYSKHPLPFGHIIGREPDFNDKNNEYIETCGFANIFTNLGAFKTEGVYSGASCPAIDDPPSPEPWEEMVCYSEVHGDINEFVTPDAGRPHHNMVSTDSMRWDNAANHFTEMHNITGHCYPKYMHAWPFSQWTEMPGYFNTTDEIYHNPMDPTVSLWDAIRGTVAEVYSAPQQCLDWTERVCLGPSESRPTCYHKDKYGVCYQGKRPQETECYVADPTASYDGITPEDETKLMHYAHCYYKWFQQLLGDWALASWIMPQGEHQNWAGRVADQINIHMMTFGNPAGTAKDPDFLLAEHRANVPDDFTNVYMPGLHDVYVTPSRQENFTSITKYYDRKLEFCKFDLDSQIAPNGALWGEKRLYMSVRAGPRLGVVCSGEGCDDKIIDNNNRNRSYGYLSAWMWQPLIPVEKYDSMTNQDIKDGFKIWNTRAAGWVPVLERQPLDQQVTWFELCLPRQVQTFDSGHPWTDGIPRQRDCSPLRSSICSNRARTVEDCLDESFRVPIIKPITDSMEPHGFFNPMVLFRLAPDDRLLDVNTVIPMGQSFYYNLNEDLDKVDECQDVLGEVRPPWLNV
eukprot:GHVH01007519.1.p1 GENE.GHVH01007519.1~~GHVH01007519.1.p1  ORF type:complete len:1491 (+),score=190.18 GHVH01007519.1:52-4524(+)